MATFTALANLLRENICNWEQKLRTLTREQITEVRNSQHRNIGQIIGHMVDSASNNTHRIVHLQYQESPISFPDYANLGNNDKWIAIQNYEEEHWQTLIQLWKYTHLHIAHIIEQIDDNRLDAVWISALDQKISLKAMIEDFPNHFALHIQEIEALLAA